MACPQLAAMLREADLAGPSGQDDQMAAHIRSCPDCNRGITQLAQALLRESTLSCGVCCTRFPAYYEATRDDHPLVQMDSVQYVEVALHLAACRACREQYAALVRLSEAEERGDDG